jgi:CheY-like chemotaxis protein
MPGMSGLALAGAVQDAGRAIPTVMMLGFAAQVSEEDARKAGVSALLQKPVRSAELDAALEQVLQAYGVSS